MSVPSRAVQAVTWDRGEWIAILACGHELTVSTDMDDPRVRTIEGRRRKCPQCAVIRNPRYRT